MISAAKTLCYGLLLVLALTACSEPQQVLRFHGSTMGTSYNITLLQLPEDLSEAQLQAQFDTLLNQVSQEMSTYIPDSTISQFNQLQSQDWFPVSTEFFQVVSTAWRLSELTAGRYDVTIAPLIDLWGFGANSSTGQIIPDPAAISAAQANTGFAKLELRQSPAAIRKLQTNLTINLSSIAKGYGVDALSDYIEQQGLQNYLVEIGGEIRAKGKSPRGDAWQIAVEKPEAGNRSVQRIIAVKGMAVATSGDYRNYFEKDGVRYSHTIDPVNGTPVTHKLASVTVLADTAMRADGWATALMVLGETNGFKLAEQQDLAAYFIYKHEDAFATRETSTFRQLTGDNRV